MTGMAIMKSDVLDGFDEIRVCTAYKLDGKEIDFFPASGTDMDRVEPVYKTLPGWPKYDRGAAKTLGDLPEGLQSYIKLIEDFIEVPAVLISTGPGREETLEIIRPFQ